MIISKIKPLAYLSVALISVFIIMLAFAYDVAVADSYACVFQANSAPDWGNHRPNPQPGPEYDRFIAKMIYIFKLYIQLMLDIICRGAHFLGFRCG